MCDTIVAVGSATEEGFTLFGKNSDREPDEAQNILIVPREKHDLKDTVQCAYLTTPQVSETARVLLCQPFWMFGAEMGANEYGVVIGNEAIFTKEKLDKIGLTGMDLVRLALERSRTARQAVEVIIELLEKYGQVFPVFSPDSTVPGEYSEGSENYNLKSYWWESERFHRKALLNFNSAQIEIQPLIINYEEEIISSIENSVSTLNQKQINEYFIRARAIVKNWGSKLDRLPSVNLGWSFSRYWQGYNKRNGII
jgi:dipeptidase